jgi:hypothetical protein
VKFFFLAEIIAMAPADVESISSGSEHNAMGNQEKEQNTISVNVGEKSRFGGFLSILERHGGVELRGSTPVPYKERTVTQYWNIFSLWFCMSCNPLP